MRVIRLNVASYPVPAVTNIPFDSPCSDSVWDYTEDKTLEEDPPRDCPLPVVWGLQKSWDRPAVDIGHSDWLKYDVAQSIKKDKKSRTEEMLEKEVGEIDEKKIREGERKENRVNKQM